MISRRGLGSPVGRVADIRCGMIFCENVCKTMADPGGTAGTRPLQMGPNSFVFACVSAKKCPHRRSAPSNGSAPPPMRNTGSTAVKMKALALADLGGTCWAHATPYGTQFFHFRILFHQKVPVSEVHAPLMGAHPPTRNPGSATD